MSRIGRTPVKLPANVQFKVVGNEFVVTGPKGELKQDFDTKLISFEVEGDVIHVKRANDEPEARAKHGLYRALLHNMVVGVTEGFKKKLIVNGVGWKVSQSGNNIVLAVGYSHTIEFKAVEGIKLSCPSATEILVEGISKELVGAESAKIRAIRKPEPYHGYGIRYSDEVIVRKEGKTGGK